MVWWIWILIGLLLLGIEAFVPFDFFLFFFGVSAIVVGGGTAAGLLASMWAQSVAFSVFAVVFLAFLRKPLNQRWSSPDGTPGRAGEIVGESVVLTEALAVGGVGKAEFRGTSWTVRTAGGEPLDAGTRCRVERVEGLVLWVSPEGRPGA